MQALSSKAFAECIGPSDSVRTDICLNLTSLGKYNPAWTPTGFSCFQSAKINMPIYFSDFSKNNTHNMFHSAEINVDLVLSGFVYQNGGTNNIFFKTKLAQNISVDLRDFTNGWIWDNAISKWTAPQNNGSTYGNISPVMFRNVNLGQTNETSGLFIFSSSIAAYESNLSNFTGSSRMNYIFYDMGFQQSQNRNQNLSRAEPEPEPEPGRRASRTSQTEPGPNQEPGNRA